MFDPFEIKYSQHSLQLEPNFNRNVLTNYNRTTNNTLTILHHLPRLLPSFSRMHHNSPCKFKNSRRAHTALQHSPQSLKKFRPTDFHSNSTSLLLLPSQLPKATPTSPSLTHTPQSSRNCLFTNFACASKREGRARKREEKKHSEPVYTSARVLLPAG